MKYLIAVILVFYSQIILAEDLRFSVPKMTCPSCAASIEKEINKIQGILNLGLLGYMEGEPKRRPKPKKKG